MKTLQQIRQEHILHVLKQMNWDTRKASEILRISESYLKKEIQKISHGNTSKQKKDHD
jgi:DNA-binding NtrC family response regulator